MKKVLSSHFERLSSPGRIGPVGLRNRMTAAPLSPCLAGMHGWITEDYVAYIEARARGGASLIVVEDTLVVDGSKWGRGIVNQPEIWDPNSIPGWKKLTDAIHYHGAKAGIQINWMSIRAHLKVCPDTEALGPSAMLLPGFPDFEEPRVPATSARHSGGVEVSRAATIDEIMWLEDQYALAASLARDAGFDVVMIHCTGGHGIASFNSPYFNQRNDLYGGPLENRMRFGLNIIKKVRPVLKPEMALSVRIPVDEFLPGGSGKEECIHIAQAYEAAGVDAIHMSCGAFNTHHAMQPIYYPRLYLEPFLADMREAVKVPLAVAGSLNDPEDAERVLRDYRLDFVDLGRALVADAEYPKKVVEGRPEDIRRCIRCDKCLHVIVANHTSIECSVNAEAGRERVLKIMPAEEAKSVVVVGGGPGGMEAARVAALRGHSVTLVDKGKQLGGNLRRQPRGAQARGHAARAA